MKYKFPKISDTGILDVASFYLDNWENNIMQWQVVRKNKKLAKQADKVHQAMYDFYKLAGAIITKELDK